MIKNNNFKTTRLEARFIVDIDKKEVPLLELLSNALIYTTKKYKTRKDFINKQRDLYDISTSTNIEQDGNRISLNIFLSFLDNKYSSDNLFDEGVNFLYEILYNPNIVDNRYDEDTFNAVYIMVKSYLETIKEDKVTYSRLRLLEVMNEENDGFVSRISKDYYEKIVNADRETLASFYKTFINNSKLDIMVFGNIEFGKAEKVFKEVFKGMDCSDVKADPYKVYKKNKKIVNRFESDRTAQAKLTIGCTIDDMTIDDKLVNLQLYNFIVGGFADSLFFKNIREKHSMCYYVSTNVMFYDNLLIIKSGIEKDKLDKMIELIKKEMKRVVNGDFPNELLEEAKSAYISSIKSSFDYPSSMVNNYYDHTTDGLSMFKDRIENIEKATIDDIKKVASKIKIDTVFLYGGDSK